MVNKDEYICCHLWLGAAVLLGSEEWKRSDPESEHSRVNVSGLEHGRTYHLRVVALGHHGNRDDVTSEPQRVVVGLPRGQ